MIFIILPFPLIFIRVLLFHFHVPTLIRGIFCTDSSYPYTALKFGAVRFNVT